VATAGSDSGACTEEPAAAAHARAARAARQGGWVLFGNNMLAYLYRELYRCDVQPDAAVPPAALRRLEPLMAPELRAEGGRVRHVFVPVEGTAGRGRRA
jgi:hypothetical protein